LVFEGEGVKLMATPKEQYDARKAERKKLADMDYQIRTRTETLMMIDMLDRFVTAVEVIADKMPPAPRRDEHGACVTCGFSIDD
jgi:hypothetical protein